MSGKEDKSRGGGGTMLNAVRNEHNGGTTGWGRYSSNLRRRDGHSYRRSYGSSRERDFYGAATRMNDT